MIPGLDSSSVQGTLPVAALVAAGKRFLYAKCQQGNDGKDPCFEQSTAAARAAGMLVGAYHFLYPLPKLDPVAQADGFFKASTLGSQPGDLPPALDLEWPDPDNGWKKWGCTAQQISDFARKCAERMTELFGRKPVIYFYPYFIRMLVAGADLSWMLEYPLWVASYGGSRPSLPAPFTTWTFWQNDGNAGAKMPNGVDSDFDFFNGDETALQAFANDVEELAPDTLPAPPLDGDTRIIHPQIDFAELAQSRDD